MRSLRILHVFLDPNDDHGDADQVFFGYNSMLKKLGHEVVALIGRNNCSERFAGKIHRQGIPVHILNKRVLRKGNLFAGLTRHCEKARICKVIRERKIELLLVHRGDMGQDVNFFTYLAQTRFPSVAVVAVEHGVSLDFCCSLRPDAFIAVSGVFAAELRNYLGDAVRVFHVPTAMPVGEGREPPAKPPFRSPPVVGCLGRLGYEKNVDRLIRAAGILARKGVDVQVRIGGDGDEREKLVSLAARLKIADRVEFPGVVNPDRRADFFAGIDIICLVSKTESSGLVLKEAAVHNVPCVAMDDHYGQSETITHEINGLLTAAWPPAVVDVALAGNIERLIQNQPLARKLADANFKMTRERYGEESVSLMLHDRLYSVVAAKQGCEPPDASKHSALRALKQYKSEWRHWCHAHLSPKVYESRFRHWRRSRFGSERLR